MGSDMKQGYERFLVVGRALAKVVAAQCLENGEWLEILQLSLQSECEMKRANIGSHDRLRRHMYAFAFKREMAELQAITRPLPNTDVPHREPAWMQHVSDPVSYEEYIQQWDSVVGGMEQGGESSLGYDA